MLQEHISSALTANGQSVLETGHSVQVINPGANLKYFPFSSEKPVVLVFGSQQHLFCSIDLL